MGAGTPAPTFWHVDPILQSCLEKAGPKGSRNDITSLTHAARNDDGAHLTKFFRRAAEIAVDDSLYAASAPPAWYRRVYGQLLEAATPVYYGENTFKFEDLGSLHRFIRSIPLTARQSVRRVVLGHAALLPSPTSAFLLVPPAERPGPFFVPYFNELGRALLAFTNLVHVTLDLDWETEGAEYWPMLEALAWQTQTVERVAVRRPPRGSAADADAFALEPLPLAMKQRRLRADREEVEDANAQLKRAREISRRGRKADGVRCRDDDIEDVVFTNLP